MITFKVRNYDLQDAEKTFLSAAASAGGASISVQNSGGFTANDFICAGNYRGETAQLRQVASVATGQIVVSAVLTAALSSGDEITRLLFDKVVLQESDDNGVSDPWADVVTQDISIDSEISEIEFASASTAKYYRTYFKNSTTGEISAYSASMLGSGATEGTLGWFKDECARDLKDKNFSTILSDDWDSFIKAALRLLFPVVYKPASVTTSSTGSTYSYDFPAGIDHVDRVFISSGSYPLEPLVNIRIFNDDMKIETDIGAGYTITFEGRTYFTAPTSDSSDLGLKKKHYELLKWQAEELALRSILFDKSKLSQYASEVQGVTENDVMNMISILRRDIARRMGETADPVQTYDMVSPYAGR
jgi:hypothetical protein